MEPTGPFAAILTIATDFRRIDKRLHRCSKALEHGRDDITTIRDEVETFSGLLCIFHGTLTDARLADQVLSTEIKEAKIVQGIAKSGRAALKNIESLIYKVKPLRTDKGYSTINKWIARWAWRTWEREWTPIHVSLNSIKQSATLLMSIIHIKDLIRNLELLRARSESVPSEMRERLSFYTKQAKTLISRCNETAKSSTRTRDQEVVLWFSEQTAKMVSSLVQNHIGSHPTLAQVINQNGIPPFSAGNPSTSRTTSTTGSPRIPISRPRIPPVSQSESSSSHVPAPRTPTPPTEEPLSFRDRASVDEVLTPDDHALASRLSQSGAGSGAFEIQPPLNPAGKSKIKRLTPLFHHPNQSTCSLCAEDSDRHLSERPIIVDDGQGIREEYRRPRRGPASSQHRA